MAMEWFSCKGSCSGSDPASDTVKVNPALLTSEKENVQPLQVRNKADGAQKEQEEKRRAQEERLRQQQREAERRQVEEQARKRSEEAARRREEQAAAERAAAERAAAEEAAAAAAAEAAAAKAREDEQRRLEAERATEEKARREREAAGRVEAQRHEEERAAAQAKVNAWCKASGFADINSKKKSFMSGSKFPLHEAVAKNNEEMVALLIQMGADKGVKNSKGQTAEDLARKMNKDGSMDGILAKLS